MHVTLTKILLELFVLQKLKFFPEDVVERFKLYVNSCIDCSSDFTDLRSRLINTSICLPIEAWENVRDFTFYLDNFVI